MSADKEEQEQRLFNRRMKKEQERIAKKFVVITPAEFEVALSQSANMAPNGRPIENDSWCTNTAANANATALNEIMNGTTAQGKNDTVQNQQNAPTGNNNAPN